MFHLLFKYRYRFLYTDHTRKYKPWGESYIYDVNEMNIIILFLILMIKKYPQSTNWGINVTFLLLNLVEQTSKNEPSASFTHLAYKSKLLSVVRSSMYLGPGNYATIDWALVVYYAHTFSAGIKCQHCTASKL